VGVAAASVAGLNAEITSIALAPRLVRTNRHLARPEFKSVCDAIVDRLLPV
jgi:hypothetical protein